MPRNISEASTQLEVYKMVIERQRIQREMSSIKDRTSLIQKRLDILNYQIAETEKNIIRLRHKNSKVAPSVVPQNILFQSNNYQTFEMQY